MSSQFKRLLSIHLCNPVFHVRHFLSALSTNELFLIKKYSSSVYTPPVPAAVAGAAVGKDEIRDFMAVFPDFVRDLTEDGEYLDIPDVTKWFAKVLQYNVPDGKKYRGLDHVASYRILCETMKITPDIRLAHVMGWNIEMLQAFLLVIDDILDGAEMRRGRDCWYRFDNIGKIAINDAILLESGVYAILKKYLRDKPYYVQVLELFHDITLKTTMGQEIELLMSKSHEETKKLDEYTMDRYATIVKYKTTYYTFQLPVSLAMFMVGITDEERHRQAERILLEMGNYYQIQDDYLNCYGDPSFVGKSGSSDIVEAKCSWLLVVALQRANAEQRAKLEECYGSREPQHIETVKSVYTQIGLPSIYAAYEEDTYNTIVTRVQQLSCGLPRELFFKIFERIYKRKR